MKKIDLHIHTQSTVSDAGEFSFSMAKLQEYTISEDIDAIAITNHNIFDMEEFNSITSHLDITVFPGVEIDIENGHLLLICDDNNKEKLNEYCEKLESKIINQDSSITIEEFKEIFPIDFLEVSLLIPHYKKRPAIRTEVIEELNELSKIYCGEVSNPKKFTQMKKDQAEELTPVLFSDYRATADYAGNTEAYRVRQTYINVGNEITVNSLKVALMATDSNQVAISKKDGISLYDMKDGLTVSTGLNVVMGRRSSGKTHFFDEFYEKSSEEQVKYIKQFELIETDPDKQEEKFNKNISQSNSRQKKEYLNELSSIVDRALDIDDIKTNKALENYVGSLKDYASNTEIQDIYSKSVLFRETLFPIKKLNSLEETINSVISLIENNEYKGIISSYIKIKDFKSLVIGLIEVYRQHSINNKLMEQVNNIVKSVKADLQFETTVPQIKEMNLEEVANNYLFIKNFNHLINTMKKEKEFIKEDVGNFTNVATRKKFTKVSQIKDVISGQYSLSTAFDKYYEQNPYEYLKEIQQNVKIDDTEIYKAYINIEISILNSTGQPVSGGQMAEYNFLQIIDGALENDILLIDEPESSFDNVFLNEDINKKIKSIAKNMPVFISTHNSTVGMSIQPDYLIFAEKIQNGNDSEFNIYTGYPNSEYLISNSGEKFKTYDALLNCFEAGSIPYTNRRAAYELLENR